jgi:hypothetical protein
MDYYLMQNFDYEKNRYSFWEVNPEFKFTEPFDDYYNATENKDFSSEVMWAIFLFCDIKSPKIRLRKDEREEDIKKYFLKDDTFSFEYHQDLIDAYPKVVMTKIQRELKVWQDKIEERNKFLETLNYDLNTFEALDKMMKDSKLIWESFGKIYKEYQEENIETRARGGREESFTEKLVSKSKKTN